MTTAFSASTHFRFGRWLLLVLCTAALLASFRVDALAASPSKVAVIGATGRLGRRAVKQLLDQGIHCTLLLRSPPEGETPSPPASLDEGATAAEVGAYFRSLSPDAVTIVEGGTQGVVDNRPALEALVEGCDACLALWGSTRRTTLGDLFSSREAFEAQPFHAKHVNHGGVLDLIEACRAKGCRRIVRVTGKGEDPAGFFSVLINLLGSMAKAWNYQGEQALRAQTDVEYTIVRPGIMVEQQKDDKEPRYLQLADDGGDLPVAPILYEDVASLCVGAIRYPNAAGCTLTAMTTTAKEDGDTSWEPFLEKVKADRRAFPADMLEQHYTAVATAKRKLALAGGTLLAVVVGVLLRWLGP